MSDLNALTVILVLRITCCYTLNMIAHSADLKYVTKSHVCFTVTCCWIKTFKIVGSFFLIKFGTCSAARSYFPHDDDEEATWFLTSRAVFVGWILRSTELKSNTTAPPCGHCR